MNRGVKEMLKFPRCYYMFDLFQPFASLWFLLKGFLGNVCCSRSFDQIILLGLHIFCIRSLDDASCVQPHIKHVHV